MAKKFFEENLKQVSKRLNLLYDDVFNIYSYGELDEGEKEEFLKIVDSIYNLNKKYLKFLRGKKWNYMIIFVKVFLPTQLYSY